MSFFGVTTLGYQNHVKEYLKQPPPTLPPLPRPVPLSMTDAYGPGAKGSYDEHRRIWVKHTRTPLAPYEIYRKPVTRAQEIGWWQQEAPVERTLPWSAVQRFVFPRSPMTKFVDDMVITDKYFKPF